MYDEGNKKITAPDVLDFWTHKTWDSSLKYADFEVSHVRMGHEFKVTKLYVALSITGVITSLFLALTLQILSSCPTPSLHLVDSNKRKVKNCVV